MLKPSCHIYTDLQTVDGELFSYFREACFKVSILKDDNQYHLAMKEASVSNSPASLCSLFAVIPTWCEPSSPLEIYEYHKEAMAEDFLNQHHTRLGNVDLGDIFNLALNDLQNKMLSMGGKGRSEHGLPQPQTVNNDRFARIYHWEIDYDQGEQQAYVEHNVRVYGSFCFMIDRNEDGILFGCSMWNM